MTKLTKYEQETIINFNEDESMASICAHNKRLIAKLNKACQRVPEHFKFIKSNDDGFMFFECTKKYITIHIPAKSTLTDEQREKLRERMKTLTAKRSRNQI